MAIPAEEATAGQPHSRPVLDAASRAREALSSSSPQRLWALSDAEVAASMVELGQLAASVDAHILAVMAEAKTRGLGTGEGWGPVDWARAKAPGLSTRTLLDLDTVAGHWGRQDWLRSSMR